MILKRITHNAKAISLRVLLTLILLPLINFSQSTIPTTTISGCLKVDSTMSTSGNLQVSGTSNFDSTLIVNDAVKTEDIEVSGSAKIAGDIKVNGGIFFKNGTGINVISGSSPGSEIYSYGKTAIGTSPTINQCFNPNPPLQTHQFGGAFQVYDNNSSGYTGGNIMTLQSWNNGSSIDVAGGGGLLINYFCGKDTYIGTGNGTGGSNGTSGAKVYIGDELYTRKNLQIGSSWQAIDPNINLNILDINNTGIKLWPANNTVKLITEGNGLLTLYANGNSHLGQNVQIGYGNNSAIQDVNTSLNINSPSLDGIKISTYNNAAKSFYINNSNLSKPAFLITGEGKTEINTYSSNKAFVVSGLTNNVFKQVFTVAGTGNTCIGCDNPGSFMLAVEGKIGAREIKVTLQNPWPDYVFEKDYKLEDLSVIEKFVANNKHLPNVPSANELSKDVYGLDIAKMQGIQMEKIEELYLYMFEMKKEIDALKKENEYLKKQISK